MKTTSEQRAFEPPYCIVPMPVDEEGNGPVDGVPYKTLFEIWDMDFLTVSVHDTLAEAEQEVAMLMAKAALGETT